MSSIIRQKNKKSGVVYCYEQESFWVPGVGPRTRRRCIGHEDPDSGEIVPNGRSGPRKQAQWHTSSSSSKVQIPEEDQVSSLKADLLRATGRIQQLEESLAEQEAQNRAITKQMTMVKKRLENVLKVFEEQA